MWHTKLSADPPAITIGRIDSAATIHVYSLAPFTKMAAALVKLLRDLRRASADVGSLLQQQQAFAGFHICCRHYTQLENLDVTALTIGCTDADGNVHSEKPVYSSKLVVTSYQEDTNMPGVDTNSVPTGRFIRDPKEWVWMPSVPDRLGEWREGTTADRTMGAFHWVRKCQPQLPHSAIHKLFRKREVRLLQKGGSKDQAGMPTRC